MIPLLYLLLFSFVAVEIPLLLLMAYIYRHRALDLESSEMRVVIFNIAGAKVLFIFAQIILVGFSIFHFPFSMVVILWTYSITAILLAITDWWALVKIRRLATES